MEYCGAGSGYARIERGAVVEIYYDDPGPGRRAPPLDTGDLTRGRFAGWHFIQDDGY
ncbi:hypothetical protein [Nitratireductor sp. XY-223]|uniref:hypothetical protein n=1 Tax=Nitratireductor sp. XY-223 TaxID=2561926 RepID=UPI00145A6244|nr:hypothetical protein [Nitratireductor sp. XY-223]